MTRSHDVVNSILSLSIRSKKGVFIYIWWSPYHIILLYIRCMEAVCFHLRASRTAWIQCITQTVTDKIDTQYCQQDQQAGEEPQPRCALNILDRTVEHIAPARGWGLNTQAQKAHIGFAQDRARDTQRG